MCENPSNLLKEGLVRQLRSEGDHASADLLQQIVAPREGQMAAPSKTNKHAEFWNTELILEKPEPPENSSIELVPYETASDSTKNAEKLRPENKSLTSNLLKQA